MRRGGWLALAVVLAGCGSGDGSLAARSGEPATTSSSTTTLPHVDPLPPHGLVFAGPGSSTVLRDLDGDEVARLVGFTPMWDPDLGSIRLADAAQFRWRLELDGTLARREGSPQDLAQDEPPPGGVVQGITHGHWAARWTSPDGRTRLGYWSGECESPSAWFSDDGGPWRPVVDGGDGQGHEARALGWAPDGRALVSFTEGICGTGIGRPGTYLVAVDGTAELLSDEQAAAAWSS